MHLGIATGSATFIIIKEIKLSFIHPLLIIFSYFYFRFTFFITALSLRLFEIEKSLNPTCTFFILTASLFQGNGFIYS